MSGSFADGSIRVALAGYGLAGRAFHAPLVEATDGLVLRAVVTNDPGKREELAEEHPGATPVGDLREALEDVDLVVIASPNRFHVELADEAIAAGRHVVVDKPLAVTAAEARELAQAAARAGVVLSPFHNRRWDDDFLTISREVEAGRLGQVLQLVSRFDRWRPQPKAGAWREHGDPKDGGGLLLDLGTHLADQAIQLLGPVEAVYAELDTTRAGVEVEDEVFLALTHASGARSHLHAGVHAADDPPRFRVVGERGVLTSYGLDPQEPQLRAGARPGDATFGTRTEGEGVVFHDGERADGVTMVPGAWIAYYEGIVRAIRDAERPPVDVADAVAVLDLLEAARESARRRAVVALG
jgi:predicted dehydrogenase